MYLFYSYDATTYIDHQTVVPSFWFRWFRPGFLITSILFDVGMLAYCIYTEDMFAVLLAVRITMGLYELSDQLWLIKHWVPFFVLKEKRRFIFVRLVIIGCIWCLVLAIGSTSSWQERNDIFANTFYILLFITIVCIGLWYLIEGGVDYFVKHRFHCARNLFGLWAISGMILGIVGLIIGDGGENELVETLNYHSAFIVIYAGIEGTVVVVIQRFVVMFEELSWQYPNPIIPPSTLGFSNEPTAVEATNGILSASNRVACDVDVPLSSIEGARTGSIPEDTDGVVTSPFNHNKVAIGDTGGRLREEDGKEDGDLEAAHGLVSRSASASVGDAPSVISASVTAPLTRTSYHAQRRFALAFDGITRRRFVAMFEELSWKYPNPIRPPSNEATTFEATNGLLSTSNRVACDVDVPISSIEGAGMGSIPEDTDAVVTSPFHHSKVAIGDTGGRLGEEDGKEEGYLEAAHGLVSQSASASVGDALSVISPTITAPLTRAGSIDVPYHAHRRFALAFDGITRRSSVFRGNILTHHIMMVKLKRHELICRELDKIMCVLFQLLMWEVVVWLAQIFLALYLRSVNTPAPPGQTGYYCLTPLENAVNSAQFVNDFVFARR